MLDQSCYWALSHLTLPFEHFASHHPILKSSVEQTYTPPDTPLLAHRAYYLHQRRPHIINNISTINVLNISTINITIINITNIEGDNEDFLHESKASKLRTCGKSPHHER